MKNHTHLYLVLFCVALTGAGCETMPLTVSIGGLQFGQGRRQRSEPRATPASPAYEGQSGNDEPDQPIIGTMHAINTYPESLTLHEGNSDAGDEDDDED